MPSPAATFSTGPTIPQIPAYLRILDNDFRKTLAKLIMPGLTEQNIAYVPTTNRDPVQFFSFSFLDEVQKAKLPECLEKAKKYLNDKGFRSVGVNTIPFTLFINKNELDAFVNMIDQLGAIPSIPIPNFN